MADNDTATNKAYSLLPCRLEALKHTPSSFPSNLSVLLDTRGECCGYATSSGSKVVVIRWKNGLFSQTIVEPFSNSMDDDMGSVDGLTLVTGVKWCYLLSGETVLVVTSFAGFSIYNTDGSLKIFQYRITHNDQLKAVSCVRGVASVGNSICIGSSEGHILVFSIKDEEGVEFQQQLEGAHESPVTCLGSCRDGRIASGDEKGGVVIWKDPTRTKEYTTLYIAETGAAQFPCLHVCWYKDMIITGNGIGTMRIFSGGKQDKALLLIEMSAHSRSISGLDIAPESGLILSVSEDSTVCVWRLTNSKTPQVFLVHNRLVKNSLLCGGTFCDSVGSMFAVAKYGSSVIMEFGKS